MTNQIIILFFLIFCTITTIILYAMKSNRNVYYKNDERWVFILNKASNIANYLNSIAMVFLTIGETILLFSDLQINITLNRVIIYAIIFFGLRNSIELFALKYFDTKL